MAGYVLNLNILVININHSEQKELSFEVHHKPYAPSWLKFNVNNRYKE